MTVGFLGLLGCLAVFASRALAQPTLVGPEFQVNTTTSAGVGYEGPDVSADAFGRFVVVWMDDYDPMGQRFNSTGTPVGSEFTVATVTSGVSTYGRDVGVASDASGIFVVVWGQHGADVYASSDVVGQRFASSGVPLGPAFTVPADTDEYQENPKIAAQPLGAFVVVWEADRLAGPDSGYDVGARRFDGVGMPLGGDFVVNETTSGYEGFRGSFEVASHGGQFVVVWNANSTIFGRRFDAAGAPQGGEFQVSAFDPYLEESFPGVGIEAGGHFMAAWNVPTYPTEAVFGRTFDAAGTPLGPEFQVNSLPTASAYFIKAGPAVAGDGVGNFMVAWLSYGVDGEAFGIAARVFDANGAPRSAEFQVNSSTPGNQLYPQVAALGPYQFVVAWTDQGTSPPRVMAQRIEFLPGFSSPLIGKALILRNTVPENPERRSGTWTSMDPTILAVARDHADDPRCNGDPPGTVKATLRFFSGTSGHDSGTIGLPCENWTALGPDTSSALLRQGWKYLDRELDQGPCSLVRLLTGRILTATCAGRGATTDFPYDLEVGADEGIVNVHLTMGGSTYCSSFDDVNGQNGSDGRVFRGRNAPAPASCP